MHSKSIFRWALAVLLLALPLIEAAAQERTKLPPGGVTLQGRKIEQFVLLSAIGVNPARHGQRVMAGFYLLPGQYFPVAEDDKGYYFQSKAGIEVVFRGKGRHPGGVWVSKGNSFDMHPYGGFAPKPDRSVKVVWHHPLSTEEKKQFKIGQTERKGAAAAKR